MKKFLSVFLCLTLIFTMAIPVFAVYETPYEDSEFFEYEGYSIHYRKMEAENQKGQILMIHGFAHTTYCWTDIATQLVSEGYTCVLVDLPDFGYSSRETADMKKLPREDIMHALMVHLSDDPWYVAGHSMGGFVAESIYDKYPESVNNMLLYGTSGNINSPQTAKLAGNETFIKLIVPFLKLIVKFDKVIEIAIKWCFFDNEYAETYDYTEILKSLRVPGTGEGVMYSFSMLSDTNYEAIKNGPPVLYMNGSKDAVIKKSAVKTLKDNLPENSVYYEVQGGGHLFIENYADEAAEVTLEFLKNNPSR